jgi:haloalkane dehalogenase
MFSPAQTPRKATDFARAWPNQTHVKIRGGHFVQEDSPDEVGAAIATWLQHLRK